ncbi:MAG: tRNA epoxyqueuosine(34) reductase QueG [Actinomycetota bacterium]|nr:tRNA epoxyqueuosine(34) reductase QueG [Actinomycetota bacterium]
MVTSSGLVEMLRQVAVAAGSTGFGVAGVGPFADVAAELHRRRGDGSNNGLTFTYRQPDIATDVRRTHPWAQRLVVLSHAYLPAAGSPGPSRPGTGRVARFATADHYRPLRLALAAVADRLRMAGNRGEVLCDDARLVDRAAAVRAGVGWWGKNAMVLAPSVGPWLLLGSVVTDAELPVTAPMERGCGSCSACLPACPTGALVAPGVLDARRCLAAIAQQPGSIPRQFRAAMGDRVYGCDDCIEACPPGSRLLARSGAETGRVDLVALLDTDDDTLRRDLGHWYLPKADPVVIRRNALVALGNTGGAAEVPTLARYLSHHRPVLRLHAAWALGVIGSAAARRALTVAMPDERHPDVRNEIELALVRGHGNGNDAPGAHTSTVTLPLPVRRSR